MFTKKLIILIFVILGVKIRRYFPSYVISDGIVEAYLPAELNDSIPLWHVRFDIVLINELLKPIISILCMCRHEDGDREDVDFLPMLKYQLYLREGYVFDPEEYEDNSEWKDAKTEVLDSDIIKFEGIPFLS